MTARIYLASSYANAALMRSYRDDLVRLGHTVVSRWHDDAEHEQPGDFSTEALNATPERARVNAERDLHDVDAADTMISVTGCGGRGGRHFEAGRVSLVPGTRKILVGPREHVFHTLADLEVYPDWASLLAVLEAEAGQPVRV